MHVEETDYHSDCILLTIVRDSHLSLAFLRRWRIGINIYFLLHKMLLDQDAQTRDNLRARAAHANVVEKVTSARRMIVSDTSTKHVAIESHVNAW